jgi:hypothetical protein
MIHHKDPLDQVSLKKQILIEAVNASPFVKGETVAVREELVSSYTNNKDRIVSVKIEKVNQKTLVVLNDEYQNPSKHKIKKEDVESRNLRKIGANPFNEKFDSVRTVAYQLESIIHTLDLTKDKRKYRGNDETVKMSGIDVNELNWNPYVFDKDGKKRCYQRDFCWSLKDKQLLIESIYNKIDCGKILIRKHSWSKLEALAKKGEKELAFKEIVDGKQRMKTIQEFIFNEFPDSHGNFYADLSAHSQMKFTDHQLFSFAEMPESTTDEEVVYQFLKMNFTGVPQSQEHLDFVKEISTMLT